MPDARTSPDLAHGVPPIAVSTGSTLANRTGSWKYIQPVYQDKIAPCNAACPVGIDIEGYMNLLRQDRVQDARELLLRENPLPGVTGRICEHNCQTQCSRARFDEAVSIHAVERWLAGVEPATAHTPAPRSRREKVAVIGSGPAGLAAAYHLARLGYAVHVIEADAEPGGWLRYGVPEYDLPRPVLQREIERVRAEGVTIQCGVRVGAQLEWKELEAYDAVLLATGARLCEPATGPHGEPAAVRPGAEFLREVRSGDVSGAGRRMVVVGGHDTALDCARTAVRLGAQATLVYAGTREQLVAAGARVGDAEAEGVRFEFLALPVSVLSQVHADDETAMDAIRTMYDASEADHPHARVVGLECVRISAPERRRAPAPRMAPIPGSEFTLAADTVLTAFGAEPDLACFPPDVAVKGYTIKADEFGRTSRPAYFACGDVAGERHTVAHAIGAGKRAAIGMDHWLRTRAGEAPPPLDSRALRYGGTGNASITRWRGDDPVKRTNELNEVVAFEQLNMAHFAHEPSRPDGQRPAAERATGFAEVNVGLAPDDALAEAKRCFNCGVCNMCELCMIFCPDVAIKPHTGGRHGFSLSYKYCKGCGVCVEECPRGAMTMTREGL
jgi:NADPH-dependent glutamate synthase beta subunit-like oxidoreductase